MAAAEGEGARGNLTVRPNVEIRLETQEALVPLLEDIKHIVEKTTGWKRPGDPRGLLRQRKPNTYRFKDDGLIPNHPRWPFIIYKSAVRLPQTLDPAAVFEELFGSNGWGDTWRDGIYDYVHYHSRTTKCLASRAAAARFSSEDRRDEFLR